MTRQHHFSTAIRHTLTALGLAGMALFGLADSAGAQVAPAAIFVDTVIVNDDGGVLTRSDARFSHRNELDNVVGGVDLDPAVCAAAGDGVCYSAQLQPIPGELTVTLFGGYDITIDCRTSSPGATASGATYSPQSGSEIFCLVNYDDVAPAATTTTTTTTTTTVPPTTTAPPTTAPPTTAAPTTAPPTTAPPTTAAPTTAPPTTTVPIVLTDLPETGARDNLAMGLLGTLLVAAGIAAMTIARRPV